MSFVDREDAGRRLGQRAAEVLGRVHDVVVVGLPRGGVPVAYLVAEALTAPLDVLLVHKLGVPFQPELAMGAIGDSGHVVLDERTVHWAGVTPDQLEDLKHRELEALLARGSSLRRGRPAVDLRDRVVVIVDDGAATGLTALAACHLAREAGARRVVVAIPVGSKEAVSALKAAADDVICLEVPRSFIAVGTWYQDFGQTQEAEVLDLLERARANRAAEAERRRGEAGGHHHVPRGAGGTRHGDGAGRAGPGNGAGRAGPGNGAGRAGHGNGAGRRSGPVDRAAVEVRIPIDGAVLEGTYVPPAAGHGVVVFAHGSGSSRHSPRNRHVAHVLDEAGLGTLLFDLLTRAEDGDRTLVFDVDLLAQRLTAATRWLLEHESGPDVPVGYFGASTGAAAALIAAAATADDPVVRVAAVVSRGGRPDLAGHHLGRVRAPTLLVVGGLDTQVIALNREAQARLRCESRLEIVPGASHLFEEHGTLAVAADLARAWFEEHLQPAR